MKNSSKKKEYNMNSPVFIKETDFIVENHVKNKVQNQISLANSTKCLKKTLN